MQTLIAILQYFGWFILSCVITAFWGAIWNYSTRKQLERIAAALEKQTSTQEQTQQEPKESKSDKRKKRFKNIGIVQVDDVTVAKLESKPPKKS